MKKTLRVERLGPKTTKMRLRAAFETVGKVDTIEMLASAASGGSQLTAIVSFTTNRDASRAIAILNGTNLDDHEIIVSWASPNEGPRKRA